MQLLHTGPSERNLVDLIDCGCFKNIYLMCMSVSVCACIAHACKSLWRVPGLLRTGVTGGRDCLVGLGPKLGSYKSSEHS